MPVENQLSCQNTYYSVYVVFTVIIAKYIKLLNPHGNGHTCTITDGNIHMLRN
jgi:hypothetical protein